MIAILSNLAKVRKLVDKTCYHLNQHNSIHSSINKKTLQVCSYSILSVTIVIKAIAISPKLFRI